jgi:RHS repeat-associated protein
VVVSDRKFGQQLYGYTANTTGTGTHTYNTLANEYVYVASGGNFDQTSNTNETSYDVYLPEVMSYSDYYPFLMKMPGRNNNSAGYRYQGQGQEEDNEFTEGFLSFEYRVHDPRIGRFLSVDPLRQKYPHYSPYSFSGNKLIHAREIEGLEEFIITTNAEGNPYLSFNNRVDRDDYGDPILNVIDENGVYLKHFKYCEFQEKMKNFEVRDSKSGIEGFEIVFKYDNGKSEEAFDLNTFGRIATDKKLIQMKDDPMTGHTIWQSDIDYYNNIDMGAYPENEPLNKLESQILVFQPEMKRYLGIEDETNLVSELESRYDYIKILNKSIYSDDEIIDVLKRTNNFSNKLIIEKSETNLLGNDSAEVPAVISVMFGNYGSCSDDE